MPLPHHTLRLRTSTSTIIAHTHTHRGPLGWAVLQAHFLTGLGSFGFHFDTTAIPIFWPLHAYIDLLFQRWADIHGVGEINRTWPVSTTKMEFREEAKVSGIAVSEAEVAPYTNQDSMPLIWFREQYTFGDMAVRTSTHKPSR